jgi:hypothetical protein
MVPVTAIVGEVSGRAVGGIVVSVELENGSVFLCCGWKEMRLSGA